MKYYKDELPLTENVAQNLCFLHKNERIKINPDEVIYIEASINYSTFVTCRQTLTTSFHLGFFAESLKLLPNFIRINKSHLININYLKDLDWQKDTKEACLVNGSRLPISRRKAKEFKNVLWGKVSTETKDMRYETRDKMLNIKEL
jgi:DNA-binding LytR/AlgR family response regulator